MRTRKRAVKVCIISYPLVDRGGIQTVTKMVIRALSDDPSFRLQTLPVRSGRVSKAAQYLKLFVLILIGYRPMFMHAYLFQACPARLWILRYARSIVWCHGIEVWGRYGMQRLPSLAAASELWAVSRFTAEQLITNWPVSTIRVVPLGVACQASKQKSESVQSGVMLRLLTVSRLDSAEKYKGHDLSLRALARLRIEGIPYRFDVVGDGDDRPRLMQLADELGLGEEVIFHGEVDQYKLESLYANASLFLLPSQVRASPDSLWGGEGFGLVYLEAAMYGIPSIAGEFGGQTDFIDHGVTGWLVPDDESALLSLIRYLARNPADIMLCGLQCRSRAMSEYSLAAFAGRLRFALLPPSCQEPEMSDIGDR